MSNHLYILEGHEAVPTDDIQAWGRMFDDTASRRVGADERGDIRVSTVFLGLDHRFDDGAPLLFETMIFGGPHDENMWRYTTWNEAEEGHKTACAIAFGETE